MINQIQFMISTRHGGFSGASDYYERSSAIKVIPQISRPTLIIHAQDDPFIPSESFRDQALSSNPYVILLFPRHVQMSGIALA